MGNVYADLDAATRAPTGNVYEQMDRAARTAPVAPAPASPDRPTTAVDVAKGIGSGLVRGGIGALGIIGDARDAVGNASEYALERVAKASGLAPAGAQPRSYSDIAAENRKLADAVQLPGSADITRAVEAGTGKFYEPQTLPGRLAEGTAEFLPSAAVGPGGLIRRGLETGAAGLASAGAGEATKGTAAEPYARVGAGLVGGGGTMAGARLIAPTTDEIIARAVRGTSPEQFAAAGATKAASTDRGMFLSGPEAVQAATQGATKLADVQRVVEASTGGGSTLASLYAQRPDQVRAAVGQALDQIAPETGSAAELGLSARQAAEGVQRRAEQARTAATTPLYDQAGRAQLDPVAMDSLMADMRAAQQADRTGVTAGEIGRLHDMLIDQHAVPEVPGTPGTPAQRVPVVDPTTGRTIRYDTTPATPDIPGTPAQPMRPVLDGENANRARKAMRERLDMPVAPGRDPITAEQQHAVGPFMDRLSAIIGDAAPNDAFRRANALHGRLSDQIVNPIAAGPVGKIARTDDVGAQGRAILPDVPAEGAPTDAAVATALLAHQDPALAAQLLRNRLGTQFAESAQHNMGGPNQWAGPKFAAQLQGNALQQQTLAAALGALPARAGGAPAGQQLHELFPLLEAQGYRKAAGSNTSGDTSMRQLIAEPGTATKLGAFALNPAAMVTHGFGDLIRRRAYDRNTGALADLFTAPDSVAQIQAMADAHHRSALADLFVRGALQAPAETGAR